MPEAYSRVKIIELFPKILSGIIEGEFLGLMTVGKSKIKDIECQLVQNHIKRYLQGEELSGKLIGDLENHARGCLHCKVDMERQKQLLKSYLEGDFSENPLEVSHPLPSKEPEKSLATPYQRATVLLNHLSQKHGVVMDENPMVPTVPQEVVEDSSTPSGSSLPLKRVKLFQRGKQLVSGMKWKPLGMAAALAGVLVVMNHIISNPTQFLGRRVMAGEGPSVPGSGDAIYSNNGREQILSKSLLQKEKITRAENVSTQLEHQSSAKKTLQSHLGAFAALDATPLKKMYSSRSLKNAIHIIAANIHVSEERQIQSGERPLELDTEVTLGGTDQNRYLESASEKREDSLGNAKESILVKREGTAQEKSLDQSSMQQDEFEDLELENPSPPKVVENLKAPLPPKSKKPVQRPRRRSSSKVIANSIIKVHES